MLELRIDSGPRPESATQVRLEEWEGPLGLLLALGGTWLLWRGRGRHDPWQRDYALLWTRLGRGGGGAGLARAAAPTCGGEGARMRAAPPSPTRSAVWMCTEMAATRAAAARAPSNGSMDTSSSAGR